MEGDFDKPSSTLPVFYNQIFNIFNVNEIAMPSQRIIRSVARFHV